MRVTDYLLTDTPRPALSDEPFTGFADLFPDPTVIDYTDAHALWMQMTMFDDDDATYEHVEGLIGEGTAWQCMQFLNFDFSVIGNVAPPFENFVMEADVRESMLTVAREMGLVMEPRRFINVGRSACAFTVFDRERWLDTISNPKYSLLQNAIGKKADMDAIEATPFRWMYAVQTYLYFPGRGVVGPNSTWFIPVAEDGTLFYDPEPPDENPHLLHALSLGPRYDGREKVLSDAYAVSQGWSVLLPSLLALSFMHTPRKTKDRDGYHEMHEGEMLNAKQQRKYLERNFRPMTQWKRLDITPLREAVRAANGGEMPTDIAGLRKALHTVRGHTRTYMPNTYFGRTHPNPITVFVPSFRRGEAKAGIVAKEYRLTGDGQ